MQRICSSCQLQKYNLTGKEIKSPDGLHYRWICRECNFRRLEREEQRQRFSETND